VIEADQDTAVDAMLVLPGLFLVTRDRQEQLALLQSLEVAEMDQRVPLAEEVAYTVAFLLAHETLIEQDRTRLDAIRLRLLNDPCAAIRRQLEVGATVGANHARKHGGSPL
jgi:hypothetical protein